MKRARIQPTLFCFRLPAIAATIAAAILFFGGCQPNGGPEALPSPSASLLLDQTRLPDLATGTVKPLHDYMGRGGLLLLFVDTQCEFSVIAVDDMKKVTAALGQHHVSCVVVNLGNPLEDVRTYFAKHDTGSPVVYDETTATQQAWKVKKIPTVVLFDAGGSLAYRGGAVWNDVIGAGEQILKLPPGSIKIDVHGTGFG